MLKCCPKRHQKTASNQNKCARHFDLPPFRTWNLEGLWMTISQERVMIHDYRILWSVGLTSCYMGEEIKKGVSEEFMSLRSSAKHKASVETALSSSLVLHNNFKVHDYPGDSLELVGLWSELQCVWIIAVVVLPCWVCPFSFRCRFVLQSSCSIKVHLPLTGRRYANVATLGILKRCCCRHSRNSQFGCTAAYIPISRSLKDSFLSTKHWVLAMELQQWTSFVANMQTWCGLRWISGSKNFRRQTCWAAKQRHRKRWNSRSGAHRFNKKMSFFSISQTLRHGDMPICSYATPWFNRWTFWADQEILQVLLPAALLLTCWGQWKGHPSLHWLLYHWGELLCLQTSVPHFSAIIEPSPCLVSFLIYIFFDKIGS